MSATRSTTTETERYPLQEYEDQMLSKSCARNDRSTICSGAYPKRL